MLCLDFPKRSDTVYIHKYICENLRAYEKNRTRTLCTVAAYIFFCRRNPRRSLGNQSNRGDGNKSAISSQSLVESSPIQLSYFEQLVFGSHLSLLAGHKSLLPVSPTFASNPYVFPSLYESGRKFGVGGRGRGVGGWEET